MTSFLPHKPDTQLLNRCPPLPANASTVDTMVYWLGIGLGSGLPQRAPGTWGSLGGLIVGLALMQLGFAVFLTVTVVSTVVGVWLCQHTSMLMYVHDDPHIVWDEWVGMWLTLLPLSYVGMSWYGWYHYPNWAWIGIGFVLFRWLDIQKPGLIGWADHRLEGGFSIMLDDVFAGLFCAVLFATVLWAGQQFWGHTLWVS